MKRTGKRSDRRRVGDKDIHNEIFKVGAVSENNWWRCFDVIRNDGLEKTRLFSL